MDSKSSHGQRDKINHDAFIRSLASSPYSGIERAFLLSAVPERDRLTPANVKMITYGLFTSIFYFFLLKYQAEVVNFAALAQQGKHIYFLVPIFIALGFSIVHGGFTAYFWESLGVTSKKKEDE